MSSYIKKKEKKQSVQWFFIIEFLLCAVIVFTTTRQLASLASAAFTTTFVLLVAWFGKLVLADNVNRHLTLVFVIIAESFVSVICSALLNDYPVTMDYMTSYLVFLSTILFIFVITNTESDRKTCNTILVIHVVIAYIYPIAYRFFPQERRFGMLDLNFSNPNTACMWLLQAVLGAWVAMAVLKSPIIKALAGISIPINIGLMVETESRNSIFALLVFGVLCAIVIFKFRSRFTESFVVAVNLVPIAFVPLYLAYIEWIVEKGWFASWESSGKNLESRVWIWQAQLEKLGGFWLIGNYAKTSGNAHNDHIVLLSSFGAIGLVLVLWYLCSVCLELNAKASSRKNLYALAAFFAVIFMGIGEGGLYSGAVGIFIPACGFLYLAKCDFGADKEWQRPRQRQRRVSEKR